MGKPKIGTEEICTHPKYWHVQIPEAWAKKIREQARREQTKPTYVLMKWMQHADTHFSGQSN